MASIRIEHAQDKDAIAEFVALHDRVYAARPARWHSSPLHEPMLLGQTPATVERELRPFVAREGAVDAPSPAERRPRARDRA